MRGGPCPPCFAPRLSSKPRLPSRGFLFLRLDSDGTAAIFAAMSVTRELRRRLLLGRSLRPFEPCLPRPAKEPPAGPDWIHEIKHDGFRIMARKDERGVRLFSRNGYNFADRFPQ